MMMMTGKSTAGTTSSTATGPNVDNTTGTATGIYLYTEASGACNNTESILMSPCLDVSSLANPFVDFYVHMFGGDLATGSMEVDVSTDGGLTWINLWSQIGQIQTSKR